MSQLKLIGLYPSLLSTYGDNGNVVILEARARWRGIAVETSWVDVGDPIPADGNLYLLGGGEDSPQARAARELRSSGSLQEAVARGAAVFAVCAGFQILGHEFPVSAGGPEPGLGLLDISTHRVERPRMVGELKATCQMLGNAPLLGYENHAGATRIHDGAQPLGVVDHGVGNGFDGFEGAVSGRVIGTYAHGPALARNPALADLLLANALGIDADALAPLDDELHNALRQERLRAITSAK